MGTGIILVLNPGFETGMSVFPISLTTYWGIRKYIKNFNIASFSYTPQDFLDIALKITNFTNERLIYSTTISFCISSANPFNELATTLHDSYGLEVPLPVSNNPEKAIIEIINAAENTQGFILSAVIAAEYLIDIASIDNSLDNIKKLFAPTGNTNIVDVIKELFIPKISASLDALSLAIEFPRTLLKPIDPTTNEPYADENIKSMLRFNVGRLGFSTTNGLEFEGENSFDFTKSEIGNTGMTLYFDQMKLDLSRTKNIPEATAAGYPNDFVGVFVKEAAIGLPEKWFKNTDGLSLVGRDLLIGTGRFSGTVGLKSNGTTWVNLGDNGFRVGFNSFDLTFRQNAIVESNIRAKLEIPNFKDRTANGDFVIDVIGHLSENGDFNLTAALSPPLQANLFNFVNFDFKSFEIGRQGSDFYLRTSCDIWFDNEISSSLIFLRKPIFTKLDFYKNYSILAA